MEYKELQKWLQSRNSFYQDNLTQYSQMETEQKIMDCVMFEEKPELWINPSVCDFFQVDNSRELRDIKVKKYKHMGRISFLLHNKHLFIDVFCDFFCQIFYFML